MATDYSTAGNRDTIEMVVRPGFKYGNSTAGEHVKIDKREMTIGSVAETLCTAKEYKQIMAAAKAAREKAETPPPRDVDRVRAAISSQLATAGEAAARARQGDARFIQRPKA